jgi:hypothetical protein
VGACWQVFGRLNTFIEYSTTSDLGLSYCLRRRSQIIELVATQKRAAAVENSVARINAAFLPLKHLGI